MNQKDDLYILIYDEGCGLCQAVIARLAIRDIEGMIRFVPIKSALGQNLLAARGLPLSGADGFVLIYKGQIYQKSDAYLLLMQDLRFGWGVRHLLSVIPKRVRDGGYDLIGQHRLWFFGCGHKVEAFPQAVLSRRLTEIDQYEEK